MLDHPFSGSALCAVDTNGRMRLPAFVRTTLARRGEGDALLFGSHESDPCLTAYDRGYAALLHADSERRRLIEEAAAPTAWIARARRLFGFVQEAALDADGHVLLPEMMRRRARIGAQVLLVGTGGAFELWNPELAGESGDPGLAELADYYIARPRAA
jgi:MraZ protein